MQNPQRNDILIASPEVEMAAGFETIFTTEGKPNRIVDYSYEGIKTAIKQATNPLLIFHVELKNEAVMGAVLRDSDLADTPIVFITTDSEQIQQRIKHIQEPLPHKREVSLISLPYDFNLETLEQTITKELQHFPNHPEGNIHHKER